MKQYVLCAEAARLLQLTPNSVRVLARQGKLPAALVVDGVRLFDRRRVERLARTRAQRRMDATDAEGTAA
jgi:DNA-binding transcriptional MerR regulator